MLVDHLPEPHDFTPAEVDTAGDLVLAWKSPTIKQIGRMSTAVQHHVLACAAGALFLKACEDMDANPWIVLCSIEGRLLPPPRKQLRLEHH